MPPRLRGPFYADLVTRLDETAWPGIPPRPLLIVPLGSTEQHGPHLPFDVDARIAAAAAGAVTERLTSQGLRAVVAPVLAYGSSGEHQQFPGTLSIGRDALRLLLVELVRSASAWAARVALITGHGGNAPVLSDVVPTLRDEGHDVAWLACGAPAAVDPPGDAHAGRLETALMLHLDPARVGPFEAVVGATAPLTDLMADLETGRFREVTPTGVLGDPRGASASEGLALLEAIVDDAVGRVARWSIGQRGELRAAW